MINKGDIHLPQQQVRQEQEQGVAWKSAFPHGLSYPRSGKFGANHPRRPRPSLPPSGEAVATPGVFGKMAFLSRLVQPGQRVNRVLLWAQPPRGVPGLPQVRTAAQAVTWLF